MKKRALYSLLVLTALLLGSIPAGVFADEEKQLDEGIRIYNRASQSLNTGDYVTALALLDQALALNTSEFVASGARNYALLDKSKVQIELGDLAGALVTIDQALALEETDKLWNNKGYVLYRLGRYPEAVTAYTTAITITPGYTVALINKGDALMQLAKYQDAVDAYTLALASDAPANDLSLTQKGITYGNMGDAYMALGKYQDAIVSYQSSLVNNPDNADTAGKLSLAQQKAESSTLVTIAVIAVLVIIGAAAWFFLKKTKAAPEQDPVRKKTGKKKPGK